MERPHVRLWGGGSDGAGPSDGLLLPSPLRGPGPPLLWEEGEIGGWRVRRRLGGGGRKEQPVPHAKSAKFAKEQPNSRVSRRGAERQRARRTAGKLEGCGKGAQGTVLPHPFFFPDTMVSKGVWPRMGGTLFGLNSNFCCCSLRPLRTLREIPAVRLLEAPANR